MKQFELLGWKVKDKVTEFEGVVSHVGLDLYGCVQALVQPRAETKDSGAQKIDNQHWFDATRLEKQGSEPAMIPIPQKGDKVVAGSDTMKPVK